MTHKPQPLPTTAPRGADISPPSSIPWPPLLLMFALVAGLVLSNLYPIGLRTTSQALGFSLIALAIIVDIWVFVIFKKHQTAIRPDRSASSLVTTGPFRWSRNPIYLGNLLILLGVGIAMGSFWFVPMALVFFVLVQHLSILPEEAHMAARFSEAWEAYQAQTRRWI
ncbi:MAG: isoprenylcysteine carboxylmethyltransferase family protein [Pseudomonadota bacterium]